MKRPRDRGSNVRSGMMRMERVEFFFFFCGWLLPGSGGHAATGCWPSRVFLFLSPRPPKTFFFSVVAFEGGRRDTRAGQ